MDYEEDFESGEDHVKEVEEEELVELPPSEVESILRVSSCGSSDE